MFIDSVALLLVDSLVGGLAFVLIDGVAHLLWKYQALFMGSVVHKKRQINFDYRNISLESKKAFLPARSPYPGQFDIAVPGLCCKLAR